MENKQKADYAKFISSLNEKKYATANKYLKNMANGKIKEMIAACAKKKLF